MPSYSQLSTGAIVIRQSLLLQLVGLVWGIFVAATPFPRLALVAHIEAMTNGPMWLGIGLLLRTDFLNLADVGCLLVKASLVGNWTTIVVEMLNAWWGTKDLLSIVGNRMRFCLSKRCVEANGI
jgi:hydroxylaminobenzene mutase